MTEQYKQLLLQDLCARLPYGVKVLCPDGEDAELFYEKGTLWIKYTHGFICSLEWCLEDLKLYLRPMSSMTEEEKKELWTAIDKDMSILESNFNAPIINEYEGRVYRGNPVHYELDFLISNHFDYRGLIPMGLALEAPEGMYKICE